MNYPPTPRPIARTVRQDWGTFITILELDAQGLIIRCWSERANGDSFLKPSVQVRDETEIKPLGMDYFKWQYPEIHQGEN